VNTSSPFHDLVVEGGEVATPIGVHKASIGIAAGRVATISTAHLDGERRLDVTGLTVLPAGIDSHTHFRDPGYPEKEDFLSGTSAAAAGGIGCVFEMPMADVGTDNRARFEHRRDSVTPRAVVDFALYGAAGQENLQEIEPLAAAGAIAFKSFLRKPYAGRELNFSGSWIIDDGLMYRVAETVARTGLAWAVHADNHAIVAEIERCDHGSGEPLADYVAARPEIIEVEAVSKVLRFAEATGSRCHIVHITTATALNLVSAARTAGAKATAEACLPHLLLTEDNVASLGQQGRLSPRLRTDADRAALWAGIRNGAITSVASDHASYTQRDLVEGWDGVGAVGGGDAGTEFLFPLLLTNAPRWQASVADVVRVLAEGPARLFGLWPR
jgi:dihydroorotase (multifunctional complex type)